MLYRPSSERPWRVVLYSHDSQGLGHIRRNLALAHSLATHLPKLTGRPVTGLLFTGFDSMAEQLPDGFDHVSLPGLTKESGSYAPRRVDLSMSRLIRIRSQLLTASISAFEPDLVIVDRHALGVRGELEWALHALREERPNATIVLGLREVLDAPEAAAREWERLGDPDDILVLYDAIWLYGDPQVHDALSTGEVPQSLKGLVTYTGYLANGRHATEATSVPKRPYVLTMVGGGSDGAELCNIAVRAKMPEGYDHIVVTGPQMSDAERAVIRERSRKGTRVVAEVRDGLTSIRGASALISMAGYNTVTEAMTTRVPHLLVPRSKPRMEQVIRAEGLAAIGAADTVAVDDLTPKKLSGWIREAVRREVVRNGVDLDGLSNVGRLAATLLVGDLALVEVSA